MHIPLYISIPFLVASIHYDNFPRAWRYAWVKLIRSFEYVPRAPWPRPPFPPMPLNAESQIVLPGGKVMKIGITNVQTTLAVDDVLRGSAEFLILDGQGAPQLGR